jgi:hypothetical protein
MSRRIPEGIVAAVCMVIAGTLGVRAQASAPNGFSLGVGLDLSAVSFADQADHILGGTEAAPGWGLRFRLGYGLGIVALGAGVEATQVATGDGRMMDALAMPFEFEVRPRVRLGSVSPGVVVGYIRYGLGYQDVPGNRLPGEWPLPGEIYRVGLIANGLRLGASFSLPLSKHIVLEARPTVDLLPFNHLEIADDEETDLQRPGWSTRYGLALVLARVW